MLWIGKTILCVFQTSVNTKRQFFKYPSIFLTFLIIEILGLKKNVYKSF